MKTKYPNLYRINAQLSYRRSPVMIQTQLKDFYGYTPITKRSKLVKHNKFKVTSGKKWFDILQFADCLHFAISDRVKKLLEDHSVTGWSSFPIEILDEPEKAYHVFYVTSVAGKLTNLEALNNYETEVHEFDVSTWNGTDFFTHKDTLSIIAVERVKELLEKNKVTNIEIEAYKIKTN